MLALLPTILSLSAWATVDPARIAKGREVYGIACALCHGQDGAGNPEWESAVRPVSFADCGTTAEPAEQWETIVKRGGLVRGLSSVMPAFGEAFSDEEIRAVVAYLRTFCARADAYPPGDLNFRRLLVTGKAFPEEELVLSVAHRPHRSTRETGLEASYEKRIGPRFQYEITVPFRAQASGGYGRGVGDVELEAKQVLHFDLRRLEIFSAGVGVTLPTGSESKGLGAGTAVFSPFLAYGKGWGKTLLQTKVEARFPADADRTDREIEYAVGASRALGPRTIAWTPAIELTGAWNTRTRQHDYAALIEASKPLNKLGHVIASLGVSVPIRPREDRYRIQAYLLWDFGDGPFWLGW
jgi:mono/diheme cytochrome c family protein